MLKKILWIVTIICTLQVIGSVAIAQNIIGGDGVVIDYSDPKDYEIGGITVSGVKYLDPDVLIQLSGLYVGQELTIPDDIGDAIRKLWKQGLFSEITVTATKVIGEKIFLDIYLRERPRLSSFTFSGLKKSEVDDIREKIKLVKGSQVTDNVLMTVNNKIKDYLIDKGLLYCTIDIVQEDDTNLVNNVMLNIIVNKGPRVKINEISFTGNTKEEDTKVLIANGYPKWKAYLLGAPFSDEKLRRAMKETKRKRWFNVFKSSKYIEKNYTDDKAKILARYNENGYRDAVIVSDSVYKFDDETINIDIVIDEGNKYYFRNVSWVGNTKYPSTLLGELLGIKPGDTYNLSLLEEKLYIAPNSVSSIYKDDGYLFSSIMPVEVQIENDSIDIEMRVYEGKQARVNKVTIVGNDRTNEHVIRREIRTKPGQLYNQSDVQRTLRELAQLGYFDPEKLNIDFNPDPANGTVDLEYQVEEKPSDQFELSGGWGARMVVGSVGLSFSNFSAKKMLKPEEWRPVPSGDGQRLSVRAQSNGLWYQGYNVVFAEPWFGGKKPNMLQVSISHTILSNGKAKYVDINPGSSDADIEVVDDNNPEKIKFLNPDRQFMKITGGSVGIGKRLAWPDDFFNWYNEISYQHYNLHNYQYYNLFSFNDGHSNNVSFKTNVSRNSSGPNPIYPIRGSSYSFQVEATPPFSMFKDDYFWLMSDLEKEGLTANEILLEQDRRKYKWIEYHKWSFTSATYTTLGKFGKSKDGSEFSLVLHTKAEFGYVGFYNNAIGPSPFEGYYMGGDGLMTYNIYGKETIPMRGYGNGDLTPKDPNNPSKKNGNVYTKYTFELRYPLSLNPSATLYALGFLEAGNAWYNFEQFNAFDVKRSAGVGVRIFLPMFGKLGVDWGYGFDNNASGIKGGSQFHFIIGQNF